MPLLAQVEAEMDAQVQQISNLAFLLRSGGLPFVAIGLALGIVGLIFVIKPRGQWTVAIYAFASLLPGLFAMLSVYSSCSEFAALASGPEVPKPAELFGTIGRAMGCSFYGLLGTVIPMLLAIIAFLRARPVAEFSETQAGE